MRFLLVALIACLNIIPLFCQDSVKSEAVEIKAENSSEYYYINIPLEKVYTHRLGYMVLYRNSKPELGRAFLPITWFGKPGGKGELIYIHGGTQWPYLSVYYKAGKIDHVRLIVRGEIAHESWGLVPGYANMDDKFNVEELKLEF